MMSRLFGAVLLSAALFVPAAVRAQDHQGRQNTQNRRYYDRTHNDYHDWNSNENQVYNQYLQQNRMGNRSWSRTSRREQNNYWNWRHQHPDSH